MTIDDILRGRSYWDALDFLFLCPILGRVTVFVNDAGRHRKIGLLSHGLAPVGDGNYLIDSRLTAAVRVYRQKQEMLQESTQRAERPACFSPPSCSL